MSAAAVIQLKSRTEALLSAAAEAQTEFWNALAALEREAGIEIDSTTDLNEHTLDSLISQQ